MATNKKKLLIVETLSPGGRALLAERGKDGDLTTYLKILAIYPVMPGQSCTGQALNRDLIARAQAAGLALEFAAHARCVEADVRAADEAGFRRVHLYIGTSKIKQATARKSIAQIAELAFQSIAHARELGFTCVRISTEDAFRTTESLGIDLSRPERGTDEEDAARENARL